MRAPSAGAISPRARRPPERWIAPAGNPRPCATTTDRSRDAPRGRCKQAAAARVARRAAAQVRLAVDQIRQRLRTETSRDEVRHTPRGIRDTARPAARVARTYLA